MGDVEPGHPDRDPRLEDDRGSLRVRPDVELGRGGRVPLPDGPAHQRDPGDPAGEARRGPQQHRDVRQRSGRDDRDGFGRRADRRDRQLHGRGRDGGRGRLGEIRPVQTRRSVDIDRHPWLANERSFRSGRDRDLSPVKEGQQPEGVVGGPGQRGVARDRRDRHDVQFRPRQGEGDGEGVIVARVAVEDDRRRHRASVAQRAYVRRSRPLSSTKVSCARACR